MNFAQILSVGADRSPDQEAVRLGAAGLTYAQLRSAALSVAAALSDAGFRRGDRIALMGGNTLEFLAYAFGTIGVGCVAVFVNSRSTATETEYILRHSGSAGIFADEDLLPVASRAARDLGIRVQTLSMPFAEQQTTPLTDFEDAADQQDCIIVYTSGTTGKPKGAVRTHGSCLWACANYLPVAGVDNAARAGLLYPIPLASIGMVNIASAALFHGLRLELVRRFDPVEVAELFEDGRVSHAYLVPSMWKRVVEVARPVEAASRRLEWGLWGGEPLPGSLAEAVTALYGDVLVGVWGSTEGGLTTASPGDQTRRPGTAGRATGNNRIRIVSPDGAEVPRGEIGELEFSTPARFDRYLDDPVATSAVIHDGWCRSGDLARMDESGYIWVVGRTKEMIISGGANIYPAELEATLSAHPAVAIAAVIGVPNDRWGETPAAFIEVAAGRSVDPAELESWCRERLAGYKIPRVWHLMDAIPTSETGKVAKAALREIARAAERG